MGRGGGEASGAHCAQCPQPVGGTQGRWGSFSPLGSKGMARARGDLPDIFVSPLAAMWPCQYCRYHASTAVSMLVLLLPGYTAGVGKGCQVALKMR